MSYPACAPAVVPARCKHRIPHKLPWTIAERVTLQRSLQLPGVSPFMWGSILGLDSAAAASAGARAALVPDSDVGGVPSGDPAVPFPVPACSIIEIFNLVSN